MSYNSYLQFRLHLEDVVFAYLYGVFFLGGKGLGLFYLSLSAHVILIFDPHEFLLLKEWQIKEILNDKIIC
jgi:hypothetical protein